MHKLNGDNPKKEIEKDQSLKVILNELYSVISSDGYGNTGWKNAIIEKNFDLFLQMLFNYEKAFTELKEN